MSFTNIEFENGILCDTYISQPKGEHAEGTLKPVIFLMDALGLRNQIFEMVDRIANEGYYVVAPNLYFRQGKNLVEGVGGTNFVDKSNVDNVLCSMRGVLGNFNRDQTILDFKEIFKFINQQKQVRKINSENGVAITGYCFGGGIAIRLGAAYSDLVKIIASFHAGGIVNLENSNSAHLLLDKVKAELYFAHADNDNSMNLDQIKILEDHLTKNNNKFTSELYSGCAHGWTMKDTFLFNENGSEKHFNVLTNLFKKY